MRHNKKHHFACICLSLALVYMGCEKIEKGFLSDNIFYRENPLTTVQGSVTVSAPLVSDGSTNPLTVKLEKVTNEDGEDVTALVTKTDSIMGFSGSVSYLDSTLELLNKKIIVTAAQPLSVNETGGRIQLTPATQYIPAGSYNLDLAVSNIRGTKHMPNACTVIVSGAGSPDTVYAGTYAGTFSASDGTFITGLATPTVAVTYMPASTNKLIYKFLDKNGTVYNPQANGLTVRTNRWTMKNFDPYYPEVLTDTSVEYQFPIVPNQFPVFVNPGVNGVIPRGNYGVFPAIPAAHNDQGAPVFVFLDMAFFKTGTYIITVTFMDVAWK